jgi:hypothetical protein
MDFDVGELQLKIESIRSQQELQRKSIAELLSCTEPSTNADSGTTMRSQQCADNIKEPDVAPNKVFAQPSIDEKSLNDKLEIILR